MSRRFMFAGGMFGCILISSVALPAFAQVATPGTPAACTKAAADIRISQITPALQAYRNATDANRADLQAKYLAANTAAVTASEQKATECAAGFSVATIPAVQLMDLITLYSFARDTAKARLATERLLTDKGLPPRARGQAFVLSLNEAISAQSTIFGILDKAEGVMSQIDGLPDSLADIKLQAHTTMLGRYEYLDVADGLYNHATAVIAIAKMLQKPASMVSGYSSLARSFADRLQPDSALRILNTGEKEIGAMATERFKDFRNRYALIGQRASAIEAQWWINTNEKSLVTPAAGKVTLIEFTAHWCGPCKNSYPGLRGLAEKYSGKGLTGVMVTQLYGYLGTRQNLSPEQEIEADKAYFGKEHDVPFPVAINPQIKQTGAGFAQPKPDADYRVGGIPQIMIVDKKGIIRQIVTGWDHGNTERFSKLIDQLLAEKP